MLKIDSRYEFETNYLEPLYQYQQELNLKIGRDTVNSPYRLNWIYDYLQALSDEIVEAKNCISWKWWTKEAKEQGRFSMILDEKNLKLELIDMLHFILSLDLIADVHINPYIFNEINYYIHYDTKCVNWLIFKELDDLLYFVQGLKYQYNYFTASTFEQIIYAQPSLDSESKPKWNTNNNVLFWKSFALLMDLIGLSIDDVYDLYVKKNKINLNRQETDYSMLTKTEDDNNKLKKMID